MNDLKAAVEASGLELTSPSATTGTSASSSSHGPGSAQDPPARDSHGTAGEKAGGLHPGQRAGGSGLGRPSSRETPGGVDAAGTLGTGAASPEKDRLAGVGQEGSAQTQPRQRRWPFVGDPGRSSSGSAAPADSPSKTAPQTGQGRDGPRGASEAMSEQALSGRGQDLGAGSRSDRTSGGGQSGAHRTADGADAEGSPDAGKGAMRAGWGGRGWVGRKQGGRAPGDAQGSARLADTVLPSIDSGTSAEDFLASMGLSAGGRPGTGGEGGVGASGQGRREKGGRDDGGSGGGGTDSRRKTDKEDKGGIRNALGRLFGRREKKA